MLMNRETILELYEFTLANGEDTKRQIKSLAKVNGVKAADIEAILTDEGIDI